jgi:hypothetical protein
MSLTEVAMSAWMVNQTILRIAARGEQEVRDKGLKKRELNLSPEGLRAY